MSIYLYSQAINEKVKEKIINLDRVDVVASAFKKGEKIELFFDNYNEDNLIKFCRNKNHENIIVHPYFWNHEYCYLSMINQQEKIYNLTDPNTILININYFSAGQLVMIIIFFNIINITYCLDNIEEYQNYLDRLNIDKNTFAQFLINNKFNFPLTENYHLLIKRIFSNYNIVDYIFQTNYNYEQIAIILNDFDYGSLNILSSYIFDSNLDDKAKLCLCQALLNNYNDSIDTSKEILLSMKNFKPYLIYYLYTMHITDDLINNYFYTWKMVLDNGGAEKIRILDDNKLNDKIKQRYEVIKDNFNL